MKKLLFIPLVVVISLTSCGDGETDADLSEVMDLQAEISVDANYEEVDVIVSSGMETIVEGGRVQQDEVLSCATVVHDEENNVLTIDFGDGCEGPGGRVRVGKIIVSYNLRKLEPGAYREVTFEDFSVDGTMIEGTRRVENISESMEDNPKFQITVVGGKMTFEDGTFATRQTNRTREWMRASSPLEDEAWIEGTASGSRRDGVSYSVEIIEKLVYARRCKAGGVFIPVSGVKEITSGDNTAVVDYGNGDCDNEVTVTINDGEPFTKTITRKKKR